MKRLARMIILEKPENIDECFKKTGCSKCYYKHFEQEKCWCN